MENFDIQLYDVILAAMRGMSEEIHTAMPGQVTAYDPVTQRADIQPMLKKPRFDDQDNRLTPVSFPVLPKVPVRWPQAGGFAFVLPMQVGDWVWIEFAEAGTGEFRTTGQESEPFDVGRHTITYPYCSPAAPPDTDAMTDSSVTSGTALMLGQLGTPHQIVIKHSGISLGGPTPGDWVALASLVNQAISTIVTAFNNHTHAVSTTGSSTAQTGTTTSLISAISPAPGSVASSEVACK